MERGETRVSMKPLGTFERCLVEATTVQEYRGMNMTYTMMGKWNDHDKKVVDLEVHRIDTSHIREPNISEEEFLRCYLVLSAKCKRKLMVHVSNFEIDNGTEQYKGKRTFARGL